MPDAAAPTIQKAMECLKLGMHDIAESMLNRICKKEPRNAEAANLLGMVLIQSGRSALGVSQLERAIKLRPEIAAFHISLANALVMAQKADRAVAAYRKAIKLDPKAGGAFLGLTLALMRQHDLHGAVEAGRQALRLMPNIFEPYANLSDALRESGEVEQAIALLREARAKFPHSTEILSLLLTARNYSPLTDPHQAVEEACAFGKLAGPPGMVSWPNDLTSNRPLRVGYLSADLRNHSVSYFLEPILRFHDPAIVETFVYSASSRPDETTERLRGLSAHWADVAGLNHASLVNRLRQDQLDLLIELGGHTNNNRLLALAKGCAPIQATYLGYPNTTGVPAIGYRIVDAITDPRGTEQFTTEQLIRLPGCFLSYAPLTNAPPQGLPPCSQNGFITFGSFNSLPKISPRVLDAWATILQRVPNSRLFLKNRSLSDQHVRDRFASLFAERGIAAERLILRGPAAKTIEHLELYSQIDIALDTFPYNGTTTTCEALWMGVPVIALAGAVHAGRVGVSLLNAAGLPSFIAESVEQYINLAIELAGNLSKLRTLRAGLRDQMKNSPLCDGQRFVQNVEVEYRRIWNSWRECR